MSATLRALTATHTVVRQAVVVSVAGSVATVAVGDSEFDATIPTQPTITPATGAIVFLISVGSPETWLVIASL